MAILDYFPKKDTPRAHQIEAIDQMDKIYASGKKYVIGILPTGSGKSHIGYTLAESAPDMARELKEYINDYSIYKKNQNGEIICEQAFWDAPFSSSFILTITKSLQDQYKDLFFDSIAAKGKSNYQCDVDPNLAVDFAPCLFSATLKNDCFDQDRCPYYKTKNQALSSKSSILNYRMFLNLPDFLKKRDILVMDEASGVEDELVSNFTIKLTYNYLRTEGISHTVILDDQKDCYPWILDVFSQIESTHSDLVAEYAALAKKKGAKSLQLPLMQRINKLSRVVNSLSAAIENWKACQYLIEDLTKEYVCFAPYDIKPIAKGIFKNAKKILLMSATISNVKEFTASLGIPESEYGVVEIGSTFPSDKSPIFCTSEFYMSYKTMDAVLPKVIKATIDLCEHHKDEKGLIHTHTNAITAAFRKKIGNNPRFLFREDGVTNEDILKIHRESKLPTILVSPSLDTGVSLDDDLGRFQIITKSPFPSLGSKRIKKIFDKNSRYYTMKMLDVLIQMCGRCTRSKDDHSVTYILDAVATKTLKQEKRGLPKHFKERIH